jgi:hypothetical protein
VTVHAHLYPPHVLAGLREGLTTLLGPPGAVSHDGGETIELWVVSDAPLRGSPQARVSALRALTGEVP